MFNKKSMVLTRLSVLESPKSYTMSVKKKDLGRFFNSPRNLSLAIKDPSWRSNTYRATCGKKLQRNCHLIGTNTVTTVAAAAVTKKFQERECVSKNRRPCYHQPPDLLSLCQNSLWNGAKSPPICLLYVRN